MYAGSPYAGAPYAGGSTATAAEVIAGDFAGMVFLLEMWADVVESDAAVSLPAVGVQRFDVVRVLPAWDGYDSNPATYPAETLFPAVTLYPEGA